MSCRRIPSAPAIASTSGASTTPWNRSPPPAASWWSTARMRTSSSSTTSASARKAHGGGEPPPRPHQALGVARVRAHDRAGEGDGGGRVLRPHLGARGRRGHPGRTRPGPAHLRRDAPSVRVLQRRVLQDAARLLLAHLSVPQAAGGPGGALARPRGRRALDPRHRRVPDQSRAEAQRQDHRGRHGRQPRRGSAHGHRL